MSNSHEYSQDEPAGDAPRGPSFEDPTRPAPGVPEPEWNEDGGSSYGAASESDAWPGADGGVQTPQQQSFGGVQDQPQTHPDQPDASQGQQQNPYSPQQYQQQAPYAQQNPYGQPHPGQNPYAPPASGYQPYGGYHYGPPMKSKSTAALLAFFLGGIGAHDFYLGKKNLGWLHVGFVVLGLVIMIGGGLVAAASPNEDSPLFLLVLLGYFGLIGNGIWALVEFIIILVKPEHELGR